MRKPWNSQSLLVGEDAGRPYVLPSLDNPDDRKNIEWGVGGLAVGLLLGLAAGSKYTFHTPVRRRQLR